METLSDYITTEETKSSQIVITKSESDYLSSVRSLMRGLHRSGDVLRFFESMVDSVERNLSAAWFKGMESCGIPVSDITSEEDSARINLISTNISFISNLSNDIINNRNDSKSINALFYRADLWGNRWNQAFNEAKSLACGNLNQIWVLGDTDHCVTCAGLAGKVKRGSVWEISGFLPQSSSLACGGFRCRCSLEDTDQQGTPGPLPAF